jgi:signal transduction histidine kinase
MKIATITIRHKVLLGSMIAVAGALLLGVISFRYLVQIEDALHLEEVVNDLSNDILEIRRYEKNYLLYRSPEDLTETRRYLQQSFSHLEHLGQTEPMTIPAQDIHELEKHLQRYGELLDQVPQTPAAPGLLENLRNQGHMLVETSQHFLANHRHHILTIVGTLKRQLIFSIIAALAIGLPLAWFMTRSIIDALHLITLSTAQIAQGDFRPLPPNKRGDETQLVIEAINTMISELEKRQQQLLQEKKLASLGVLTAGIAHQLNNPLNNISTSCQILREEEDVVRHELARELLSAIYQEVLRARDIVKGLLEFSRATEFSRKPTPLAAIVQRAVQLVDSHRPAGILIDTRIPDTLILPIDAQRMQEVFLNLLINAIQAMGEAGRITIEATADPASGMATIQVADTGPGIPAEYLGRVFDPFFTLKENGKGTGLGLSIVFGIIKKHGGTISAENRPDGPGARFTIRLPLHQPEDA